MSDPPDNQKKEQAEQSSGDGKTKPFSPSEGLFGASTAVTRVYRRNLPHWQRKEGIYWVTFRLSDALPQSKLTQLRAEKTIWLNLNPEPWTVDQQQIFDERFGKRVERWLDTGFGSCTLAIPEVRQIVQQCLTRFDGKRLRLHAAVIMPNHVHALIQPYDCSSGDTDMPSGSSLGIRPVHDFPKTGTSDSTQTGMSVSRSTLSSILKGIKGASAREANKILGRSGVFWMDESYDRIVRDENEYRHYISYIRQNPIKANLHKDKFWLFVPE